MTATEMWESEEFQEKKQQLEEAFEKIKSALLEVFDFVREAVKRFWNALVDCSENSRVRHLARNHHKARVRKKNWNRIIQCLM